MRGRSCPAIAFVLLDLLVCAAVVGSCSTGRGRGTTSPPATPAPRRICGDLLRLGVPLRDTDLTISTPDRPAVFCKIDRSLGTFCLEGVTPSGNLGLRIHVESPQGSSEYATQVDVAKYLDGSRRLVIDLGELQPALVTPAGPGVLDGSKGRHPEQEPGK